MSLTKEDLQAIADLIDVKLEEQDKKIQKRFDQVDQKFEEVDKRFDQVDQKFEEVDKRFDQVDHKFEEIDKRFDKQEEKFKEMLIDNNLLIAEYVQRVVRESEERLTKEIQEIKRVTAGNCYEIVNIKSKIS